MMPACLLARLVFRLFVKLLCVFVWLVGLPGSWVVGVGSLICPFVCPLVCVVVYTCEQGLVTAQ